MQSLPWKEQRRGLPHWHGRQGCLVTEGCVKARPLSLRRRKSQKLG